MARGIPSTSTASAPLPVVSFVKVKDDASTQPAGVHDNQARSYGYNDFSEFRRPLHYIRHIEPLESELAIQVEYDMDEQDQEWLDVVNAERKKEQLNPVTYETFEIIMDRLEKEWFDLTKNLPKPDLALPSEDSTCAICDDSEGENSNAIVFCDGCNLAVHQDCYGVPYIPEGQWLCRKCTVSPENPVTCILCPNEGGAFKQTIMGEWVHLLCAIWVPETRVANDVFMEPITGVDKISKQRWKLKCSICDIREGACIQCAKTSCFLAFHATCARKEKLLMPMKATQGSEPVSLTCYCEKHLPREQQEVRTAALGAEESGDGDGNVKSSKSARAYAKTYKPGPPLVPALIIDRIMQYIGKINVRKKPDFVLMVCKYWSLKREARRGAPLLKRLHLEPWTSSTNIKHQTEEDKATKLEYLQKLRNDLEQVRRLVKLSYKREKRKFKQVDLIQGILSDFIFPHEPPMRLAFEKIMGIDRLDYFKHPVSKTEVPDYFDIVKNPMCWSAVDAKLERHQYWDMQKFKDDINLVVDNAMLYNKPGTTFHKAAHRIKTHAESILNELDHLSFSHDIHSGTAIDDPQRENIGLPESASPYGDLEPPLHILELLFSEDGIKEETTLILNGDPLTSLFTYEMGQYKPLQPPKPKQSKKRARKSDQEERRRQPKETTEAAAIDESPGFLVPRTRRAIAAAAAFEAEAHGKPVRDDSSLAGNERKRSLSLLPGPPDAAPTVEDVDNQQSFKMFDAGWILPPDQKRGGRVPAVSPRKRSRTDPGASRLSVFSTAASENQTLHEGDDTADVGKANGEENTSDNDDRAANRVIIIEELDTPATRREKNMRRKAEKRRLAAEESAAHPPQASSPPKTTPAYGGTEMDSELSSLSDSDSDADGGTTSAPAAERSRLQKSESTAANFAPSDFPLEGGTLVWAKADTYPWWPAVIYEDDDSMIPKSVLKQGKISQKRRSDPLHLVQFYDKASSWQWLDQDRLKPLGENKGLDEDLLSTTSHQQRWKSAAVRQECRTAYRRAMAEMETSRSDVGVVDESQSGPVNDIVPAEVDKDAVLVI